MKNIVFAGLTAAMLISTGLASADEPTETDEASNSQETSERESYLNKTKCKVKRVTGSRLQATKRCMTNREWELLAEQSKKYMQHKSTQTPGLQEGGK